MRVKDYIFLAKSNLSRRKKSVFISCFLIVVSMLVLILSLSFTISMKSAMNKAILKNISYRTIVINGKSKEDIPRIMEDVKSVSNVIKVVSQKEYSYGSSNFYISGKEYNGSINLLGADKDIQPNIIAGREIEKNEKLVCIIPKEFYPYNSTEKYQKDKVIDGESLIGKEIKINYNSYYYKPAESILKNTFSKTFTVIGVYDNEESFSNNNDCYISFDDIYEIQETIENDSEIIDQIVVFPNSVYAIIDSSDNMKKAVEDIQNLGYNATPRSVANIDLINVINVVAILITVVILLIVVVNLVISSIKSINDRSYEIGMLKAIGYKDKNIQNIVFTENLIIGVLSYIITLIFAFILMLIAKYKIVSGNRELVMMNININLIVCLIAFLISTIIPILTAKVSARKALTKTIVQLNKEG